MRRALFAATAVAPFLLLSQARAEVVITAPQTTPVRTATAANGAPDDVRVSSTGAVRVTSGTAVTLDSDDNVTNEGTIEVTNANGGVGLLVEGGRTGAVINRGNIFVLEDYTAADADNDGDADGPFAQGSGRYGVRVAGASPFVGSLTQETAGRITVEGNDSFGVSIESGLTGNVVLRGATAIAGDRSRALSITGAVSGDVTVGAISAQGQGAIGADVAAPIGGRLVFGDAVNVTGYRFVVRPPDVSKLDADDLLQGGPAVRISGNVAGGVLVDVPPADTNPNDADEDDDGIPDANEGTGAIRVYGSAPGLLIAGPGALTVGALGTGLPSLDIRGRVEAQGVYDGVSATAVQIGQIGSGAARLTGGLRVGGVVSALAVKADATAIRLGAGADVPSLLLQGQVLAEAQGDTGTARAVVLDAGALAPSLRNTALTRARVVAATGDAIAVEDRSGTLTLLENTGTLLALRAATTGTVTGRDIAADLSFNTTGATVRQTGVTDGDDGGDNTADPDADGDGVDDADEPAIVGDILFGSGGDRLELLNGTLDGDVSFGLGADRLIIDGGAQMRGAVSDSDGLLSVEVRKGSVEFTNTQPLQLTTLDVAQAGQLVVTLDPATAATPVLQVSGAANFATGSGLGVRLTSLVQQPQRFSVLDATTLEASGLQLTGSTPFLFVTELVVDEPAGTLAVDVRRRTAAEAGFNAAQTSAYDAFYSALGQDEALRTAFLARTDQQALLDLYDQVLPEHAGGTIYTLATGAEAFSRMVKERARGEMASGGFWVQEVGFGANSDPDDATGFDAAGFGVLGGFELLGFGGAAGISGAFMTTEAEDITSVGERTMSATLLEGGLYWRGVFGPLTASARGAIGWTRLESDRRIATEDLQRQAGAEWSGLSAVGHLGVAYEVGSGRFYARPEASLDAFLLREGGYEETGGGGSYDLQVDERTGRLIAGTAMLNLGARFGRDISIAPEIGVGWRHVLSGGPGDTTARFGASGTPFTIESPDAPSGAAVLGLGLTGGGEGSRVSLRARAEVGDNYQAGDISFSVKVLF
ncbi:MAG TPA: autotransporter outer membrane beta-barrel domain-containing protein [Caulobacteraceae bacterium]|jgi:outer membrane autotransporter protein